MPIQLSADLMESCLLYCILLSFYTLNHPKYRVLFKALEICNDHNKIPSFMEAFFYWRIQVKNNTMEICV